MQSKWSELGAAPFAHLVPPSPSSMPCILGVGSLDANCLCDRSTDEVVVLVVVVVVVVVVIAVVVVVVI